MREKTGTQCPYINAQDARCARQFTLRNLNDAFFLCAGAFHRCAVYHQLRAEVAVGRSRPRAGLPA
jgi:hypothetical protein